MKKRLIIGLIVGATVFAAVFAMAATLGVTSDDLGAGDQVVATCDDAVATGYATTFSSGYRVNQVTVSGIDVNNGTGSGDADAGDCIGAKLSVTLVNSTGTSIGTNSTAVTVGSTGTEAVTINNATLPLAEDITGVHVVISG